MQLYPGEDPSLLPTVIQKYHGNKAQGMVCEEIVLIEMGRSTANVGMWALLFQGWDPGMRRGGGSKRVVVQA